MFQKVGQSCSEEASWRGKAGGRWVRRLCINPGTRVADRGCGWKEVKGRQNTHRTQARRHVGGTLNSKQATEQISHWLRAGKARFGTQEGRGGLHHSISGKEAGRVQGRGKGHGLGDHSVQQTERKASQRGPRQIQTEGHSTSTCPVPSTSPRS